MRAAVLTAYGPPEVLELRDIPPPTCAPGELLIDVHAAGINPVDYKIRDGCQRAAIRLKLPTVLGMDVSGVVAEVGAGVSGFSVGDEVFSSPSHKLMGCYAEQVAIPADQVAKKPKNMSIVFNHNKRNIVAKGREKRRGVMVNTNSKVKQKFIVSILIRAFIA